MSETRVLHLSYGLVRVEWCDTCLVSHAFADVYTYPGDDLSRISRCGVWGDHITKEEPK